jgi:hypothetical protein
MMNEPLITGRAEGKNRFRTRLIHDPLPAISNLRERFGPRNPLKTAHSFGACSTERIEDSIGVMDAFEVVIDFAAECSAGEWVLRITTQRLCLAISHFDQPCAGIRAVMSAGATDDFERG